MNQIIVIIFSDLRIYCLIWDASWIFVEVGILAKEQGLGCEVNLNKKKKNYIIVICYDYKYEC